MVIEHIAMYVNDLEGVRNFFVRFFNARPEEKYENARTGLSTYFLGFDDGCRLELMKIPQMESKKKSLASMGYIHLAFSVGSRGNVDALTEKLYESGYEVISGPRISGNGTYMSRILGPEDNQIDIVE